MRKDDPESVSAEDLHRLLVVARWAVVKSVCKVVRKCPDTSKFKQHPSV